MIRHWRKDRNRDSDGGTGTLFGGLLPHSMTAGLDDSGFSGVLGSQDLSAGQWDDWRMTRGLWVNLNPKILQAYKWSLQIGVALCQDTREQDCRGWEGEGRMASRRADEELSNKDKGARLESCRASRGLTHKKVGSEQVKREALEVTGQ